MIKWIKMHLLLEGAILGWPDLGWDDVAHNFIVYFNPKWFWDIIKGWIIDSLPKFKHIILTSFVMAVIQCSGRICAPTGRSAFQYVNWEWSGGRPAAKRGSAAGFLGRQICIHYQILTKFGILMGTMAPHLQSKFYQNWPPGGRDIEYAWYFWTGHVPRVPESERLGARPPNLAEM